MINEECKGCTTYPCEHVSCYHTPAIGDIICPCSICLVKTMCVDGCDAHEEYLDALAAYIPPRWPNPKSFIQVGEDEK